LRLRKVGQKLRQGGGLGTAIALPLRGGSHFVNKDIRQNGVYSSIDHNELFNSQRINLK
jgi:hypothetical protein